MNSFSNQFPASFAPPAEVLALLAAGILKDSSWGNDIAPSFQFGCMALWCDAEDVAERELAEGKRYWITEDGIDHDTFSTDDVGEAVAEVLKRWESGARIPNLTEGAEDWGVKLYEAGLAFHLEDEPADIVGADGKAAFTPAECEKLRGILDAMDGAELDAAIGSILEAYRKEDAYMTQKTGMDAETAPVLTPVARPVPAVALASMEPVSVEAVRADSSRKYAHVRDMHAHDDFDGVARFFVCPVCGWVVEEHTTGRFYACAGREDDLFDTLGAAVEWLRARF